MAPLVSVVEAAEGENLVTLGEASQLVILMLGSVVVVLGNGACVATVPAVQSATLRHPFFGELGLLHNQPAGAHVRAASAVKCLTVSRSNFARFLALLPDFEQRCVEIARHAGLGARTLAPCPPASIAADASSRWSVQGARPRERAP